MKTTITMFTILILLTPLITQLEEIILKAETAHMEQLARLDDLMCYLYSLAESTPPEGYTGTHLKDAYKELENMNKQLVAAEIKVQSFDKVKEDLIWDLENNGGKRVLIFILKWQLINQNIKGHHDWSKKYGDKAEKILDAYSLLLTPGIE